ncbi:MAG TPA: 4-(cytidine 5'-diphospho)-2-C-methyl-D-erythritol kinase [Terracidiphilus sp.]
MPTAVRSHAKINLGLHIGAPRPDGFHALTTVYQTLEVYDTVTITAHRTPATSIRLSSNDPRVPTDSRNTAWKIVVLALESLRIAAEVEIHIEKRLPVQGGLGAGSANAVAALVGLEKELDLLAQDETRDLIFRIVPQEVLARRAERLGLETPLPGENDTPELRAVQLSVAKLKWAAQVGSDVPLFLIGGTVLGTDRGQRVSPLPDIPETWCLLAIPSIGISTPRAFADWDALCTAEGLTPEASADKLNELSRTYASAFGGEIPQGGPGPGSSGVLSAGEDLAGPLESVLVRTGIDRWIQNDFERVVFPQHPPLSAIKHLLAGEGLPEAALHASLSGSGSAVFGLYKSREDAEAAQRRLGTKVQGVEVRSMLTRTLPRSRYWREMLLEEVR